MSPERTADVCLILEGTYPYTLGGVSGWAHELIRMHPDLTFALLALVSPSAHREPLYTLPDNVVALQTLTLQTLPEGKRTLPDAAEAELFAALEGPLLKLQSQACLDDLAAILAAVAPYRDALGRRVLLDSPGAWEMLVRMYRRTMPAASFLDYFWSWRGLFGGLYSVLLAPLPPARLYHALCTGYAGLALARAHLETKRPCIVTEHGIYTNERRIEILSADWLDDSRSISLSVSALEETRELKDFWIDTFNSYSRLCYDACDEIITLYEGNQAFQRMDGAAEEKLRVIPNGIEIERFAAIRRADHPPTVALIGRVVPIKDVKTYIRAIDLLRQSLPTVRALMIGPSDEDPEYAAECRELVDYLQLQDCFTFTGKVRIEEYLGGIDVLVLTSLSEAQPLVILEAGAAGIPTVATDIGACREMILGPVRENPALGAGGVIVPLADPKAVAQALLMLLTDPEHYARCCRAITERVRRHYRKSDQYTAYDELYRRLTGSENSQRRAA